MFKDIFAIIKVVIQGVKALKATYFSGRRDRYGYIADSSMVYMPGSGCKSNVYLSENTVIHEFHNFITQKGKFTMKRNSIAAMGLTVITSEHGTKSIGDYPGNENWSRLEPNDVTVDEDVWIGAHVTLCPGVHIKRGCIVATGSVCVKSGNYPEYSIIGGNPAKFIKFRFTKDDLIKHEIQRFEAQERLKLDYIENLYANNNTL